jgi:hypothetical protein
MNKKYIVSYVLVIVLIGAIFHLHSKNQITVSDLRCPEDYKTDKDMDYALEVFSGDFYSRNPDANIGDWAKARQEFYISHNCTKTLQAIEDYKNGEANPTTKKIVDDSIDLYLKENNIDVTTNTNP